MASYLKPKPSIHTKILRFCPPLPYSFITSFFFPHQSLTIPQDPIQVFPLRGPTAEEHPAPASTSPLLWWRGLCLLLLPTVITTGEAGALWVSSEGPAMEAGAAFGVVLCKLILLNPCRDQTQGLKPARQVPTSEPHTQRPKKTSFAVCLESGTLSLKPWLAWVSLYYPSWPWQRASC